LQRYIVISLRYIKTRQRQTKEQEEKARMEKEKTKGTVVVAFV